MSENDTKPTTPRKKYSQENTHNATKRIDKIIEDYIHSQFGDDATNIEHNISGTVLIYFDKDGG